MTLKLDLPPRVEERLQRRAERAGVPLGDIVAAILDDATRADEVAGSWPTNYFAETYGCQANDPIERLPQGQFETRELLQ